MIIYINFRTLILAGFLLSFCSPSFAKSKKKHLKTDTPVEVKDSPTDPVANKNTVPEKGLEKSRHNSLGVVTNLSYEKFTTKTDQSSTFGGLGFQGGALYSLHLNPKMAVPLSSGFHVISLAGANDFINVAIGANLLYLGAGFDFWFTQNVGIGFAIEKDIFLSGTFSATANDNSLAGKILSSYSFSLTSFDLTQYGIGGRFFVTKNLRLDADFLLSNGSFTVSLTGPNGDSRTGDPSNFTGQNFRLGLGYFFL